MQIVVFKVSKLLIHLNLTSFDYNNQISKIFKSHGSHCSQMRNFLQCNFYEILYIENNKSNDAISDCVKVVK